MTNHVAPVVGCNLGCTYCYEEPGRQMTEEKVNEEYDIEDVLDKIDDWADRFPQSPPGLHGGEPLLIPKPDLRKIYERIRERWDEEHYRTHIQTNATLVDDDHIEIFKEYSVSVGVSCDGPKELNDERTARQGGSDVTRRMTDETHSSLDKLIEEDVNVGVITVLHKINAGTDEKLEKLLDWIDYLNENDVAGHYNPAIPYEDVQQDISLSPERLAEVYIQTWEWMMESGQTHRTWDPMRTFQNNLMGYGVENCVQTKCDVFNTNAAPTIDGGGETTGCGKGWDEGDGVPFLQGESTDNEWNETEERYEMLKQIPGNCPHYDSEEHEKEPDMGGLKGCRYWLITTAGCPGAGMDDDYRNRSVWHYPTHKLYHRIEGDMRRMFPGIKLVTDLPWDMDIYDELNGKQINIKPFSGIRMDTGTSSGVRNNADHTAMDAVNESGVDADKIEDAYVSMYGEENVTADKESRSFHGDVE